MEHITCGDTEIAAAKLEETVSKMKNKNIFQHQLTVIAITQDNVLEDSQIYNFPLSFLIRCSQI